MIKKLIYTSISITLLSYSLIFAQLDQAKSVNTISYASLLDKVRITISCDGTPSVTAFTMSNPERIVLDLNDTRLMWEANKLAVPLTPVRMVEAEEWQAQPPITRITIELETRAAYKVLREQGMIIVDVETKQIRPMDMSMQDEEKTLSLYVKDADITDLLRMIATQFNMNIIITPDVKSVITVMLTDVPLMGAIDALVRAADCNYVTYESGIIMVKPKGREIPGELDSRIYELDYSEAPDIEKAIRRALSARGVSEVVYRRVGEGGNSKRASAIIVTDYPEVLDKLETVIAQLDRPIPQIAIEAKFIETTLTGDDMYGINWSLRSAVTASVPSLGDMALPIRYKELVLGKISFEQLSAALDIMQTRGKSKLIANPKTITLDNQTAEINMGISVPLRSVRVDPQTQERVYTWTEKFIPIGLKVTPHTTSDGMINMEIEPRVEAITGWQGSPDDQRPVTVRREAKTQVIVKDGEVVVIGGLIKDEETRVRSKIPILGDIPILGKFLFSQTSIKHEKSELLIFIIPHIIKP
ncbi:MAG: AMIN domain-containing protein [Candidatus Latescibacteria bacterium]|nr:AMIN domain-containing protein [Candidatus Latescibacterota bacterium]